MHYPIDERLIGSSIANPEAGYLIQSSGGLRKIRLAATGHGKRGGARIIYYHFVSAPQIAFLLAYPKGEQEDLTSDQKKVMRQVVEK
ncbi:type II toxin-antitoxin system RelE/ParE family toxin [Pseudomonas sp. Milli4]|uniref:Type II toxin-antitoxin system RelE/ParE family toxin n=1 Tax=Pseudomonas schmalbachii TaxID=2816993 RepID=A0ABS3TKA8_9PSED|nr:type II toxin-antitoxin system RelE/ParE family toxin [Pseudomonas schmalbachii]